MIYIFTRYERLGASSRVRTFQYFYEYNKKNLENFSFNSLISNKQLINKYKKKKYQFFPIVFCYLKRLFLLFKLTTNDLIYIEKELYPYIPFFIEFIFL